MSKVIGFIDKNNIYHYKTCSYCGVIVEFKNSDIIRDDMSYEIICPNCGRSIKF